MPTETDPTESPLTETDRWIGALRAEQDRLAARVRAFSPDELVGPSACTDWTIAQVLSHLGSGAEIMGATVRAAVQGIDAEPTDNQAIWDRWNAMSPAQQAAGFLDFGERIVADLESLDAEGRADTRFDISFLPEPADVATVSALRLNELTLHAWDVFVMDDAAAPLPSSAVDLLIDRAGALIGFIGHPEAIESRPVHIAFETVGPARSLGLELDEQAAMGATPPDPAATVALPAESLLRLVAGRLTPEHTPAAVSVTGALSLDDLRRVFPGY
jgi:uncharacterized protein (TIGR03083 family)